MKIAIIPGGHFKYKKGGSELQCQLLANELSKKGHEVFFINTLDKTSSNNVPVLEKNQLFYMYNIKKIPFFEINFIKYLKILSKENPDIIFSRILKWQPYLVIISKILKIPIVFNLNTDKSVKKYQFDNYFIIFKIEQLKNIFSFRFTDKVISQTNYQRNLLKKNFRKDSIVIKDGHLIPQFQKKSKPPIIIWISNIKKLKQPELFIKLAEECRELDAEFIFAGRPTVGDYQKYLIKKTSEIENLKYIGEISFEKTNQLLSKASIFINTSIYEGFPNTFIQSWMRQTPTISLNSNPDGIITRNKLGFCSGNFEKLVEDVKYLIYNENIRKKMGENARNYAFKNHNIEKNTSIYIEIFKKLILFQIR